MKRFLCGESSLTCGHCLTNGADDLWLPAKLSPWVMEVFRELDEPVGFHEKPLPKGYARSLMETLHRDVFGLPVERPVLHFLRERQPRSRRQVDHRMGHHWVVHLP